MHSVRAEKLVMICRMRALQMMRAVLGKIDYILAMDIKHSDFIVVCQRIVRSAAGTAGAGHDHGISPIGAAS